MLKQNNNQNFNNNSKLSKKKVTTKMEINKKSIKITHKNLKYKNNRQFFKPLNNNI